MDPVRSKLSNCKQVMSNIVIGKDKNVIEKSKKNQFIFDKYFLNLAQLKKKLVYQNTINYLLLEHRLNWIQIE